MNLNKYLIALTFIFLILSAYLFHELKESRNDYTDLSTAYKLKEQEVEQWQDESGRHRARIKTTEASLEVIEQVYAIELDSLRTQITGLKKNLSNLSSIQGVSTVSSGTVNIPLVVSVPDDKRGFNYSDKWIDLSGTISDTLSIDYTVRDSIVLVAYYQRDNIFRRKELKLEGISFNPNTRITGLHSVRVQGSKPKKISVGIGVNYNLLTGINLGASVHYSLIRF